MIFFLLVRNIALMFRDKNGFVTKSWENAIKKKLATNILDITLVLVKPTDLTAFTDKAIPLLVFWFFVYPATSFLGSYNEFVCPLKVEDKKRTLEKLCYMPWEKNKVVKLHNKIPLGKFSWGTEWPSPGNRNWIFFIYNFIFFKFI